MKKNSVQFILMLVIMFSLLHSATYGVEGKDVVIGMRIYEGFHSVSNNKAKITSSYYLKSISNDDVFSESDAQKEEETLKRVFNLADINRMSEVSLKLNKESNEKPFQVIVLNGRKLLVQLYEDGSHKDKFRVEVFVNKEKPKSLLDSKIILPQEKSTVLGFEDSEGHIYFLAFHRHKDGTGKSLPEHSITKKPEKENHLIKSIKSPKLVKRVEPVYPEVAIKAGIEGTVVMEAITDVYGRVIDAKVINGNPVLRRAAIDAIRYWVYEPYIIDGEKKPVKFNVVVRFKLPKKEEEPASISAGNVPKLIKKVLPKYTEDLAKSRVEGKIVLEATIDQKGNVINVTVIDGNPKLNDLAINALKQWKYEPCLINGVPTPVKFTVVVRFVLK